MKPSTYHPLQFAQLTSASTTDVQTVSVPGGSSALWLSVEGANARITFHGADPSSTVGHVYPSGITPVLIPIGPGTSLRVASTTAAATIVDVTFVS